jgi:ABC-2 type transport system ATP-binding protein
MTPLESHLPTNSASPAIRVDNIAKSYSGFSAVRGITFEVPEGEIFGLLGANGAGKTTLIRMLTTLIPITSGAARILGFDVFREPDAVRRMIGVIPQTMTSDLDLTIEENLSVYAKLHKLGYKARKARIPELLQSFNLSSWGSTLTKHLSGGMRRRLEIARGLIHDPRVFFLDEPTTGLDPVSRLAVWKMLKELRDSYRMTILITTHHMEEAEHLCDRIAIVDKGLLVALDTPAVLKANVPTSSIIDIKLSSVPEHLITELRAESGVFRVENHGRNMLRIAASGAVGALRTLLKTIDANNLEVTALSVQTTTLNDVFAYYTATDAKGHLTEEPQ